MSHSLGHHDVSERTLANTRVRIAVIGAGYWGPNLVRALYELSDAEVVAACDPRPSALEALQRRYPTIRMTHAFSDVLADHDVEAVAIATPVSTHFELAQAALEHGKHVFVEKPLATSVEEAEKLVQLAHEQGLILMPGHTFLYSPPVTRIKQLIDSGELGEIYFVSTSRVNLGLHQPDVSVIWDLAPHDFSIIGYWLDQFPVEVSAISRDCIVPGVPDVAFISASFGSGTIAHIELSWLAPSKLRRTAVVGSEKMIVYDDTSNEPVRIFDSGAAIPDPKTFGQYRMTYRSGDIVSPKIDADEPLALELADFCAAVATRDEPRSSAQFGLEVVRAIAAVERSLRLNGAPTSVAPEQTSGVGGRGAPPRILD